MDLERHNGAFDKTALGKFLIGDAGKLLTGSSGQGQGKPPVGSQPPTDWQTAESPSMQVAKPAPQIVAVAVCIKVDENRLVYVIQRVFQDALVQQVSVFFKLIAMRFSLR
jgi:hypothetical protein